MVIYQRERKLTLGWRSIIGSIAGTTLTLNTINNQTHYRKEVNGPCQLERRDIINIELDAYV